MLQTAVTVAMHAVIAVLEQPSPSRIARQKLGRRNIVLSQSDELNGRENSLRVIEAKR